MHRIQWGIEFPKLLDGLFGVKKTLFDMQWLYTKRGCPCWTGKLVSFT